MKRSVLKKVLQILILGFSVSTVCAADNMRDQVLALANIELEKYFVQCGDSWFGGDLDFMGPYAEMKRKTPVPSISVYNLTEANKLNGLEWSGTITYRFGPSRRGYVKNKAIIWREWNDYGEHFTVHSVKKNGQWQSSSSKRDDQESWAKRGEWFSTCEVLTGQPATAKNFLPGSAESTKASFISIGRYSCFGNDHNCSHTIQLWRDSSSGIVGLMGYPVMEADTPTRVIEQVKYNPVTGALSFQATFLDPYEWKPNSPPPADEDRGRSTLLFSGKLSSSGALLRGVIFEYRNGSSTPLGKGQTVNLTRDDKNTDTTFYPSLTEWQEAQIQFGRLKLPRPSLPNREAMIGLADQHKCFSCHNIDTKLVGPAWKDIASKYRGIEGKENRLVEKVRFGGAGAWGSLPEVPHTTMPQSDIRLLVQFILSL